MALVLLQCACFSYREYNEILNPPNAWANFDIKILQKIFGEQSNPFRLKVHKNARFKPDAHTSSE